MKLLACGKQPTSLNKITRYFVSNTGVKRNVTIIVIHFLEQQDYEWDVSHLLLGSKALTRRNGYRGCGVQSIKGIHVIWIGQQPSDENNFSAELVLGFRPLGNSSSEMLKKIVIPLCSNYIKLSHRSLC